MIVPSLLDTDLYKFTMMQVVLHQYPSAQVKYRFYCRTPEVALNLYVQQISDEIDALCTLRFTQQELNYLSQLRFIKPDFVDFLQLFQLNRKYVHIDIGSQSNGGLELTVQGPWLHTILFDIPLLAIISETWFRNTSTFNEKQGKARLNAKIEALTFDPIFSECSIAEYGTRRRYSHPWHATVVTMLREGLKQQFAGTSNVYFAMRNNLTPLGTMAHEYLQAFQALGGRLADFQVTAFDTWAREYRGDLGIALTDVVCLDAFLRDFDLYFCKLFDGFRHDSGDPFWWGEKIIAHLQKLRIDPCTKLLVFSDGLTVELTKAIYLHFKERCQLSFGIGTQLTNDLGPEPLQIVMKMVNCNDQPVAKISDASGKQTCEDTSYLKYLHKVFKVSSFT